MNSKKFLDQLGLIALISKIKQALNGKQNVDMVVTITQSGNAYSCDTSIANIVAAHDAGRDVYAVLPPVSDGSSTKIKLIDVQNYGSGTVMMVSFGGIINNGTNNVLYSVSGTRQNNLDAWSVSQKTLQEKLVSGTSIKTINGNTLLGSGDVAVNGSERVTATWNASTSAYVSGTSVDNMYQSFYTDGKVLELHLVNGNWNGMVLTCHGGYTDGSVRHMKFSGVTDDWIVSCDVVGTAVTVTYTSLFDIYEELNGKQDTISLNNKVDTDLVEYRGSDTARLGNGDSVTEALQTLDAAITNLGTPNEIASIATQESTASGGNNVVTITDTDGTVTSFNVKNGIDGQDGADGADGVSLGEIALVQTTGDATDAVMSQKAVTDYGRKVTNEDVAGTSDWIKTKLTELGWTFGSRLYLVGLVADSTKCASPMIDGIITAQSVLTIYHGTTSNYGDFTRYDASNSPKQYITESGENVMTVTVNTNASAKFRFTVGIDKIGLSYVYDNTHGKFLFRGDEYIYNILSSYDINIPFNIYSNHLISQELGESKFKALSQDAVRREIGVAKEEWNVTYLQGKFIDYDLAEYPDLDPRSADGISFVFTSNVTTAYRSPFFSISNPSASINNGFASNFFGLWWWDGYIRLGRLASYSSLRSGGYTFTRRGTHYVITYDFKTGEYKYYCNGKLNTTHAAPSDYDEQSLRSELATYSHLYFCGPDSTVDWKTNGIAVFGHVLDEEDVTDLFGNGNISIKDTLLQDKWLASKLHPISTTNWGLYFNAGSGTALSGGGYELIPASDGRVLFGFNGIQDTLINNVNYEWDFEVTSGTCVHLSSDRASRTMRYKSNYFKCFTIYDENGNDVTYETLTTGNYHVLCKPDNVYAGYISAVSYQLIYYFMGCSEDFSMTIKPTLKLTERGAALYCTTKNYKGEYWELANGVKMPLTLTDTYVYASTPFVRRADAYIEDTVMYKSNVPPQFNGQIAVDSTNGKVYIGYLTGTGGTWKQVSN